MTPEIIEKINKFTRREFTEEELYVFDLILCDNEIDRDCERFSDGALEKMSTLFIGKTGIFDHNAAAANQNARIFDTELVTDNSRTTRNGEPYKYLKASAYMVRTDENKNLIAEIDGGIKKEVSISCSSAKRICSVCGRDRAREGCEHVKGKLYNGRLCHIILDDVSDAYEWSFVAVPAQVNAGVTKKFRDDRDVKSAAAEYSDEDIRLRCEIRRLAFFRGGRAAAEAAEISARGMNTPQLRGLKKAYERIAGAKPAEVQLMPDSAKNRAEEYKI